MLYTGTLMTENAFYPIFLCVALVCVRMLERPTRRNQLGVLALCLLAFLTRQQAVALLRERECQRLQGGLKEFPGTQIILRGARIGGGAILCLEDVVIRASQDLDDDRAHRLLVVDEKDGLRHGS